MSYQFRYAYLHGFASGPNSKKGQHLERMFAGFGIELLLPDLNRPSFARLSPVAILSELDAALGRDLAGPRLRLIGSSLGGWLAALFAERHPGLVDRLVLIAPAFDFGERWQERMGEEGIERWLEQGDAPFVDAAGDTVRVHSAFLKEACALPQRPRVTVPTLLLHGTNDDVIPVESSRAYARELPNVELLELDADHPLSDQEARVAAETQRFFELGRPTLD
ncbi:MAG: alpha/beta fold hydrolase [Myxococcales bacterium]|nr:alpha/beta fold hydrolase [Myxococcales bacterium]MCB9628276.1 alpha/beta fold hydrolase [Sandaracinaceae bacterium]